MASIEGLATEQYLAGHPGVADMNEVDAKYPYQGELDCGKAGFVVVKIENGNAHLALCKQPMGDVHSSSGGVFQGHLFRKNENQRVVVKFDRTSARAEEEHPADMNAEIENVKSLTGPMFMKFVGRVDEAEFEVLKSKGVNMTGLEYPGGIFQYIPGDTVAHYLQKYYDYKMRMTGNISGKLDLSVLTDIAACFTTQMILAHMFMLSQGKYNVDMHTNNVMADRLQPPFRIPGTNISCPSIKVVDLGRLKSVDSRKLTNTFYEVLLKTHKSAICIYNMNFENPESESPHLCVKPPVVEILAKFINLDSSFKSTIKKNLTAHLRPDEHPVITDFEGQLRPLI